MNDTIRLMCSRSLQTKNSNLRGSDMCVCLFVDSLFPYVVAGCREEKTTGGYVFTEPLKSSHSLAHHTVLF